MRLGLSTVNNRLAIPFVITLLLFGDTVHGNLRSTGGSIANNQVGQQPDNKLKALIQRLSTDAEAFRLATLQHKARSDCQYEIDQPAIATSIVELNTLYQQQLQLIWDRHRSRPNGIPPEGTRDRIVGCSPFNGHLS